METITVKVVDLNHVAPTAEHPNTKPGIRIRLVEMLNGTTVDIPGIGVMSQGEYGRSFNLKMVSTPLMMDQQFQLNLDLFTQYTRSFKNEKGEDKTALWLKPKV